MTRARLTGIVVPAPVARGLIAALFVLACVVPALAGDTAAVSVRTTVPARNTCAFTGPTSAVVAFGNIDPANAATAMASATLTVRCGGMAPSVTFALAHDGGLHKAGPNATRMKHATLNEYLPYTLTLMPSSANAEKDTNQTITVGASVSPANAQNAPVGAYADTVVVTLYP